MINRKQLINVQTVHVLMLSFLMGGMGSVMVGLQDSLKMAELSVRSNLKVIVFIQQSVKDEIAKQWSESLPAQDAEIESVDFVSRQEALEKAQENPALVKSLILLRENPLPSTAIVRYKDSAWLERPEPAVGLQSAPEIQELRWDPEARSLFQKLRQWRVWVMRLSLFAVILMGIWASMGLYRYWLLRSQPRELLKQLGIGLVGGGLALLMIQLALHRVGLEASAFKPALHSPWPLVAAALASVATYGWKIADEK